jgi:protein-tyrosine phosphatase
LKEIIIYKKISANDSAINNTNKTVPPNTLTPEQIIEMHEAQRQKSLQRQEEQRILQILL